MRPSVLTLRLLALWALLGLAASIWPSVLWWPWLGAAALLLLVLLADGLTLPRKSALSAARVAPGRFALGVPSEVTLTLRHTLRRPLRVLVHDGLPPRGIARGLPWHGVLPPDEHVDLCYDAHFTQRGMQTFSDAHILANSWLGLWRRLYRIGGLTQTRCYPNYEPVVRFALLATANREEQMGIVKRRRMGATLDFHQLREYQDGDILSRVDWKATSRRQNLISRDYEEQRNQTLILVPDCGRRMRAMDGELSQFDHCLNAMLLIAYIALKQGDEVGVVGFGGTKRSLKPVKGTPAMPKLLNHLYDYETTTEPSDFTEAAERVMALQKRRALIILMTNLRSEDSSHLMKGVRLMQRRHLVLVATLREAEMEKRAAQPIGNLHDALGYGALCHYFQQRSHLLDTLRANRIFTVDETAQNLPVALANEYLDLKAAGRI
ncbi:MAG TPA: DUF58 domain-containing protein [Prosthecobacter sp.]|nr:DUF58 domain-containing protein [Prosthecobacter sp.]